MAFTRFTLPKKAPDTRCNGRMRANGIEAYCGVETNEVRCPAHDSSSVKNARAAKAKQAIATSTTLRKTTEWWMNNGDMWYYKSRFLSVDRHLLLLSTLIDEVGNRKPLASMTKEEIEDVAKLIKGYAELSLARTEATLKLWDKVAEHWGGADWLEDYVWLLIREMGMVYNLELLGMQKETPKTEKVQAQQTGTTTLTNGSTQVQTV